jgi:Asp-tRNA(Asn)/Glu-tRNA(Gln) amidotransferase C subunit
MKEYVVHIDVKQDERSCQIVFHSLSLTVLFLAIDDFVKSTTHQNKIDMSVLTNAYTVLESLSNTFESELTIVDEQNQIDQQQRDPTNNNNNSRSSKLHDDRMAEHREDSDHRCFRARQEPALRIAYPGAE